MKISVLNIPRNTKSKVIYQLFVAFGQVKSCELVMDTATGKSKGFGFVEMEDETAGQAAIEALHGKQVGNQKIRVKAAV